MDQLKLTGPLILTGILKSLDGENNSESGILPKFTSSFLHFIFYFYYF